MSDSRPGLIRRVAIAVLIALPLTFWAVPYTDRPFGLDHGIFAWTGDVLLQGGVSYRDAWDVKGPAVHLAFAALRGVLGLQTWGVRVLDLAIMSLGAILLWRATHALLGAAAAWGATLLAGFWYVGLNYENTAQPDGWAGVLLLGTIALLDDRAPSDRRALLLGILCGAAALLKPFYAAGGAIALAHCLAVRGPGPGERLRSVALVAAGAITPLAAAYAWLTAHGALADYFDIMRYAGDVYTASAPLGADLRRFARELAGSPALSAASVLALLGVAGLFRTRRALALACAVWLAATTTALLLGGWFYPYHWLPMYPALALLAMAGLKLLVEKAGLRRPENRANAFMVAPFLLALGLGGPSLARAVPLAAEWWRSAGNPAARAEFERRHHGEDGRHDQSLLRVADYLRSRTEPGEAVEYFGMKAGLYYFAGRPAATRFGVSQPMLGGGDSPYRRRYRTEFLAAVERRPPRWVAARREELCAPAGDRAPFDCLLRFPAYADLVRLRYAVDTTIGSFAVHRLLEPGGR